MSTPSKPSRKVDAATHAASVNEIKIFTEPFVLHPESWNSYKSTITLTWTHVDFKHSSRKQVPKKPGLYAFAVQPPHMDFPPSSWLFYVGEVGATGSAARTLWRRYKEYLDELDKNIRKKVGTYLYRYQNYVRFYYCELDPKVIYLKALESNLISALWPEGNVKDYSASTRDTRRAFS
ncbi:hypothetical protein FJ930_29455 [Mesorhizobium sp. B2-4-15]|uniref:hypothetical protein n=1 Tax=Mesorhizobium sp. B2-4-15 TaxID=2589934 RepID=UPI00114F5216|nr:hypothetical protein [Mesorhizobium sp. B2-4-15]TPK59103.1 hypothetical protein FJ930_29455 [Mesorhizobium sp. B2-4-15]